MDKREEIRLVSRTESMGKSFTNAEGKFCNFPVMPEFKIDFVGELARAKCFFTSKIKFSQKPAPYPEKNKASRAAYDSSGPNLRCNKPTQVFLAKSL